MIRTVVSVVGHGDDAHWLLRNVGAQHFHVPSGVLVRPQHRPAHPVRPEDVVAVHSQAEGMDGLVLQQDLQQGGLGRAARASFRRKNQSAYVTAAPVVFAALDLVQRGVGEVELLSAVVDGQAVGGFDVTADDHEHVGAVQGGPHDAGGLLVPVGPEHQTVESAREPPNC